MSECRVAGDKAGQTESNTLDYNRNRGWRGGPPPRQNKNWIPRIALVQTVALALFIVNGFAAGGFLRVPGRPLPSNDVTAGAQKGFETAGLAIAWTINDVIAGAFHGSGGFQGAAVAGETSNRYRATSGAKSSGSDSRSWTSSWLTLNRGTTSDRSGTTQTFRTLFDFLSGRNKNTASVTIGSSGSSSRAIGSGVGAGRATGASAVLATAGASGGVNSGASSGGNGSRSNVTGLTSSGSSAHSGASGTALDTTLTIAGAASGAAKADPLRTWTGGANTGAWGTGANWDSGSVPAGTDSEAFNAGSANNQFSIRLGANRSTAGITFGSTGTQGFIFGDNGTARNFTFNGDLTNNNASTQTFNSELTIIVNTTGTTWNAASGGFTFNGVVQLRQASLTLAGSGSQTISTFTNFGGSRTLTNNSTGTVTFSSINLSDNNTGRIFTIDGSGSATVTGVVADGNSTSALTYSGTGKLTLQGTNTYGGLTTVSSGIMNIQNGSALGVTTIGTTVSSGGTLQLQGGITVGTEALTINGTGMTGQNGALVNVSGTNNYGGLVTLGSASTISSDSGTLNLTNTGTITGATFGLTLTGSGNGSISSVIGTTTGTLTKNSSGTWTLNNANTYTGLTTVTAGTLAEGVSNAINTGALTVNGATAIFNLGASHSDSVGTVTLDGGGAINGTGTSTLTSTGSFEMKSGTVTAILAGSVPLNKTTTGTVTLFGNNTYTGGTTVNGGTLLVDNTNTVTGSGTGTGAVTVNSGGTLGGTGRISGTVLVNSGGNIAPGNGGNTTAILSTGALTLASTSNFRVDINGPTVGTQYDQLNVTGTVTLTGSNLVVTVGGTVTVGQQFTIINNDGGDAVTGTFAGLAEGATFHIVGDGTFQITYVGGTGNDVVLTAVTAVPEPSTWIGGALAVAALAYTQRRKLRQLILLRRAYGGQVVRS